MDDEADDLPPGVLWANYLRPCVMCGKLISVVSPTDHPPGAQVCFEHEIHPWLFVNPLVPYPEPQA